ncbi:hypothetical protein Vretifemale_11558 [Volvox reticuliferus]|uniref:Uncharacterized protein n=1 Tax=Volvox reticuliferus TaxID=1737510 RepID=A0A8J4FMS9_9CHLO|nr:hypothetical protein Vretifemale_11558 [Volvox reticuliferus]
MGEMPMAVVSGRDGRMNEKRYERRTGEHVWPKYVILSTYPFGSFCLPGICASSGQEYTGQRGEDRFMGVPVLICPAFTMPTSSAAASHPPIHIHNVRVL